LIVAKSVLRTAAAIRGAFPGFLACCVPCPYLGGGRRGEGGRGGRKGDGRCVVLIFPERGRTRDRFPGGGAGRQEVRKTGKQLRSVGFVWFAIGSPGCGRRPR